MHCRTLALPKYPPLSYRAPKFSNPARTLVQTLWHSRQRFISYCSQESRHLGRGFAAHFIMSGHFCYTASIASCSSPFRRDRCSKPSRKPLLCRAVSKETQRQASDQQAHRDHLSRRQAILSAAAVIVLPTFSHAACAQSPGPPPGMFADISNMHYRCRKLKLLASRSLLVHLMHCDCRL